MMKKHLWITGSDSARCSDLLREALGPALAVAGGYVKDRAEMADGRRALLLSPAASAAGVAGYESYPFFFWEGGMVSKDNEVFRSLGVRLLREAVYYSFAVLDDIGGFELVVPQFRQALAELLSSDLPLLGVLKGQAEACAQAAALGLGERFTLLSARLHDALREDDASLVLDLDEWGCETARRILQQWIRDFVF